HDPDDEGRTRARAHRCEARTRLDVLRRRTRHWDLARSRIGRGNMQTAQTSQARRQDFEWQCVVGAIDTAASDYANEGPVFGLPTSQTFVRRKLDGETIRLESDPTAEGRRSRSARIRVRSDGPKMERSS